MSTVSLCDDCCGLLWPWHVEALSLKPLEKKRLAKAAESVHSSDLPWAYQSMAQVLLARLRRLHSDPICGGLCGIEERCHEML